MATSLNRLQLIGRVGKNPDIVSTSSGKEAVKFTLATTDVWTDKQSGDKREQTEWHNIVCWREGTVNFVSQYVEKGDLLYVEGALKSRQYEDKTGVQRRFYELNAQVIQLLSKPQARAQDQPQSGHKSAGQHSAVRVPQGEEQFDESTIPF